MILPDIEPPLLIHVVNLAEMESLVVEIRIPCLQAQKTMPAGHLHGDPEDVHRSKAQTYQWEMRTVKQAKQIP